MTIKAFIILLILAALAFAQDGISPDTLYPIITGNYEIWTDNPGSQEDWCSTQDNTSDCWKGFWEADGDCELSYRCSYVGASATHKIGGGHFEDPFTGFNHDRGFAIYDFPALSQGYPDGDAYTVDSVDLQLKIDWWTYYSYGGQIDTVMYLYRVTPYDTSDCDEVYASYANKCNYYKCGDNLTFSAPIDSFAGTPISVDSIQPGWISFDDIIPSSLPFYTGDSAQFGFNLRYPCGQAPSTEQSKEDMFQTVSGSGDTASMFIYHFHSTNDISYQGADGISPDTIQFICSDQGDEVRTPGYWLNQYIPDWDTSPDVTLDCFHGHVDSAYGCGDSSRCANYWNYAEAPRIIATNRDHAGYNDFQMARGYFLFELEEPIPDTTELDSLRLYVRFESVANENACSLHVVTYEPRYSANGLDCCYVCYGCDYPSIDDILSRWCNFWECGEHRIFGEPVDRSMGRVPVYTGWDYYNIHPTIVDFSTASVGDTFGIGLVLKGEGDPAPEDSNEVGIMINDGLGYCPYIVYWFSEPEDTSAVSGYINYGLKPPYVNYGLPLTNPRRAWGGSRK